MAIRLRRQGGGTSSSASPVKPSSLQYGEPAVSSKGDLFIGNGAGGVTELISENGGQTINGDLNVGGDLEVEGDLIAQLTQQIFLQIYPVGSIYMSTSSTDPRTRFGGTWTQIQGKFLIGVDSSHRVNSTGGSLTHSHLTKEHKLTANEIPPHKHSISITTSTSGSHTHRLQYSGTGNNGYLPKNGIAGSLTNGLDTTSSSQVPSNGIFQDRTAGFEAAFPALKQTGSHTHTVSGWTDDFLGPGHGHTHGYTESTSSLPPYYAVYIWRRTA